ncbi:MAG TPA: hypothetical protein PKX36_05060 [Candidatus Cloacimonadota bacterium]|nr:hypothetical protein [Candidatus Cloacimonadota bacterium]
MKNIPLLTTLLLILLSVSGCRLFKQPTLEKIHDVKILKLGVDKIEMELSLSIHNPNCYKLKLDKLNVDLLSKDRVKIGSAALQKTVIIPKRKSNALYFSVSLDTRPTARMISLSNQSVYFYISGKGHGKVLGFGKKFEFEEPYELDLKKYLEELIPRFEAGGENIFKLKRSYVKEMGLTQAELAVEFILMNPFGLGFNLKGFPAEVWLGDTKVGNGNLASQLRFDENIHSKDGAMIFKISNFKALWSAVKGVVKGEIPYSVKGTVIIDAFGMEIRKPYQYSGTVPVNLSEFILNKLQ